MDNNIENNSDKSDITFVDTYKCVNKKTLLGSFDVKNLFGRKTDNTNDTNDTNDIDNTNDNDNTSDIDNTDDTNENKNTNKMTILLISNDDSSKILETLKEIICDFYYG